MKIGYFNAAAGAAGDMIAASLIDAGLPLKRLEAELGKIPLSGYRLEVRREERNDPRIGHPVPARRFLVRVGKHEHGRSYGEIVRLVEKSRLEAETRRLVLAIYRRLAEAESVVHNGLPDHFHQIGETDSIVDIASAVIGLRILGVERLYASALNLGRPAPATALLARGRPARLNGDQPEQTTPTAAAILAELARFEAPPPMRLEAVGYGAGSRIEPEPNILSFYLGETETKPARDEVLVLETNLDDLPPNAYEPAIQAIQAAGSLDFILLPGLMKKGRPGQKLEIILPPERLEGVLKALFTHTSAFGTRLRRSERVILEREWREVEVAGRKVRMKIGRYLGREVQANPEYEDLKTLAEAEKISLARAGQLVQAAFLKEKPKPVKRTRKG